MRIGILWTGAIFLGVHLTSGRVEFNRPHVTATTLQEPHHSRALSTFAENQRPGHETPGLWCHDETRNDWLLPSKSGEESRIFVDYAGFIAQDNFTYMEFFVQLGHNHLHFTRNDKAYQAIFEVDFYVEDQEGNGVEIQSARDTVRVFTYDETLAASHYRVARFTSYLHPGNYRLRAIVTDKESDQSFEVARNFSVRDFSGSQLRLSDLQFSRNIELVSSSGPFVKHNRYIEPNVLHLYGQFAGHLFVYYEIYNLSYSVSETNPAEQAKNEPAVYAALADSFRTLFVIRNDQGQEVKEIWKLNRKPGASCVQSVMLPIDDLPSGQYSLTVRVVDEQSQTIAETSGRFNIQWPVFALKDQKYDVLLEQLRVIASREELQKLSRLDTADRQRGLFEFWQQRDPTPGTPQNEAMDEFYRRVRYASRRFRWIGGEGWKSPQGQIYLMHGQPDEIRRYKSAAVFRASEGWILPRRGWPSNHPEEFPSPALVRTAFPYDNTVYEVWEYDQLNRRFVFVDTRGTGIYELSDPLSFDNPWSR